MEKWKACFEKQDFQGMTKQYNKILEIMNQNISLEKVLEEAKEVQNIHNLIKNNGQNFNITEIEKSLAKNLL